MSTETQKMTIEESIRKHFLSLPENSVRGDAWKLFGGFPSKKDEEYKFTPTDSIFHKHFSGVQVNPSVNLSKNEVSNVQYNQEGHHLVFLNGIFLENESKIIEDSAIDITESSDLEGLNAVANMETDPFTALNTALLEKYLRIEVKKGRQSKPVYFYHLASAERSEVLVNTRVVIRAEEGSESYFVEKTVTKGENSILLNKIDEIDVANNASVNYSKLQLNDSNVFEIDGVKGQQARDSRLYVNTFTFKGGLIRNNLNIAQNDENCETHMHGLYLLDGKSHVDNHTSVDHRKPNSYSNELYKGIVDGSANAVFNGKIFVRQDAQKTNAFQSNNNISLSDSATINTKPQLEIWADDVSCSHGCTIGQLDEEAVYYLRARGIGKKAAVAMLLEAFARESFEYLKFDFLKEELATLIHNRLAI